METSFKDGYEAFCTNQPEHANPYNPRANGIQYNRWNEGWNLARLDAEAKAPTKLPVMSETSEQAFKAGYDAYQAQLSDRSSPYHSRLEEVQYNYWQSGYTSARLDAQHHAQLQEEEIKEKLRNLWYHRPAGATTINLDIPDFIYLVNMLEWNREVLATLPKNITITEVEDIEATKRLVPQNIKD